jgi:hypothetical protein
VRRRFYFQAKARSQVDAQHDSAMEEEREERTKVGPPERDKTDGPRGTE